jgi:hypothetical protein
MSSLIRRSIVGVCAAGLLACGRDSKTAPARAAATQPDSAAGEVTQYALMKNQVGWFTDSNAVALASMVNGAGQDIARIETQEWRSEAARALAADIIREHAAFQFAIDSLSGKLKLPAQVPAVQADMRAAYDTLAAAFAAQPVAQRDSNFVDALVKQHAKTTIDFAAIAGNTSDPDLRALIANRGILMEQTHVARAQLLAASAAKADSAAAARDDSVRKAKGRTR